jgi:hypothetical protein
MKPGTVAALAAAALAASLLPAAFGLAFLVSVMARRPLFTALARHWPWLTGGSLDQPSPQARSALARATTVWGVVLLAVGIIQGIGAVLAGLSVTNPASVAIRTLFALVVLAALSAGTAASFRRHHAALSKP